MKWCTQKTTNSKRNLRTGRSSPSFEVSCTLKYNLIAWKPAVGISLTRRFLPKHHCMLWWDGLIRVFCIQSENKVHLHAWIHLSVFWPIKDKIVYSISKRFPETKLSTHWSVEEGILTLLQHLNDQVESVIKQLVHMSAVHSSRYEALRKFREHSRSYSSSRLRLEQLLRIFRALQTSRDEPTRWTQADVWTTFSLYLEGNEQQQRHNSHDK